MKQNQTHISLRSIALLMALVLVVGIAFVVPSQAADTANLGKIVDYFQANSNTLTLNANSRFFLESEPTGELLQTLQLAQRQFAADGIPTTKPMDIVWGDTRMLRSGDIYITLVENDSEIGTEGYKIVAQNYATVTAEDVDGLLYGLNMLQKHFRNGKSNSIKGFTTYDTPDTKERTAQLDCARKYLTAEYICNFVKEMSWMGYNTLQLHFSEDGGFRADLWDPAYYVEGHYKPENDFTWLCGSKTQYWTHKSTLTGVDYREDPDEGSHLSTADLIDIINTCKEYHIDIIPSFDSPAHMDYLTWKFEQHYKSNTSYSFKYNGETFKASTTSGCINYVGAVNQSAPNGSYTTMDIRDTVRGRMSQAFVLSIYKDMADFFRYYAGSTKFNIGADEVGLSRTGAWTYDLFPGYINKVNKLLNDRGYTSRMFNDFIKMDFINQFDDNIEILYWNSPYNSIDGTANANAVPSVSSLENDGRTLYNCINQHTYYVLRINDSQGDARSKTCYQWEFYGSDEESIYNDWFPNNIRKKGKYTEPDAIVPTAKLGGAYFLTWHDYAAVNTETEIWNGVKDNAKKTGEVYSLRKRMWSNITKMWNHDINSTLNFTSFGAIRDTLGDFPGLQTDTYSHARYANATTLPAATAPIQLADHTVLTEALANKISKGSYSDETYNDYLTAYNAALLINNNNAASAEELGQALADLKTAESNLAIKMNTVTVTRYTTINGTDYVVDTLNYSVPVGESTYELFIPALNGYKYLRVKDTTFHPSAANDGSGHITGNISNDLSVSMWYENQVNVSRLNNLLADAITEQGNYTADSWRGYTNALAAAQKFTLTPETQQATVLALVKALEDARTALVVNAESTYITLEKLTNSYNKDGQVGLYICTSGNVPNLVFTKNGTVITPNTITAEVQTLTNGEIVKYWLVFFPADAAGTYTYAATYGTTTADITVTVS